MLHVLQSALEQRACAAAQQQQYAAVPQRRFRVHSVSLEVPERNGERNGVVVGEEADRVVEFYGRLLHVHVCGVRRVGAEEQQGLCGKAFVVRGPDHPLHAHAGEVLPARAPRVHAGAAEHAHGQPDRVVRDAIDAAVSAAGDGAVFDGGEHAVQVVGLQRAAVHRRLRGAGQEA